MHSFVFGKDNDITDLRLVDLLFATETFKLNKEAPNLLTQQVFEGAN